ncbi:MAG: response regulator [Polyangiaceae bacterium]
MIPRPMHLVLVDDDPEVLTAMGRMLRAAEPNWLISMAKNGREALNLLSEQKADVVVTDLHMPVMDGFQLLQRLERSHPETIRIVHSSHTATLATELLRYLAHNVLTKPTPASQVLALLRWAVRAAGDVRRHPEAAEA